MIFLITEASNDLWVAVTLYTLVSTTDFQNHDLKYVWIR